MRTREIFKPNCELDLQRIFHKQQISLGGVSAIILGDLACLADSFKIEEKIYNRMKNKVRVKNKEEAIWRATCEATENKIQEMSIKLVRSGDLLEKRLLGQPLISEERRQISEGLKILKQFRRRTFKRQIAKIQQAEKERASVRSTPGS